MLFLYTISSPADSWYSFPQWNYPSIQVNNIGFPIFHLRISWLSGDSRYTSESRNWECFILGMKPVCFSRFRQWLFCSLFCYDYSWGTSGKSPWCCLTMCIVTVRLRFSESEFMKVLRNLFLICQKLWWLENDFSLMNNSSGELL